MLSILHDFERTINIIIVPPSVDFCSKINSRFFFYLTLADFQTGHYSRFGVFLFKIGMDVKTVQIVFFGIEIIISVHISSLKKVLPKCEN